MFSLFLLIANCIKRIKLENYKESKYRVMNNNIYVIIIYNYNIY